MSLRPTHVLFGMRPLIDYEIVVSWHVYGIRVVVRLHSHHRNGLPVVYAVEEATA